MRRSSIFGLLGLVVFSVILPLCSLSASSDNAPSAKIAPTADEALVLQIVNAERASHGLGPLQWDGLLTQVARDHSKDMAERNYFGHIEPAPSLRNPLERYASALGRKPECVVGENIASAPQPQMSIIHENLMASPEHRANLLDPAYSRLGVGIYATKDGQVWLTQMFGGALPPAADE